MARLDVPDGPGGEAAIMSLCIAVFLGLGRSLTVLGVDQSCPIDV